MRLPAVERGASPAMTAVLPSEISTGHLPLSSVAYYQRRLPHWHPDGRPVFLTWHLRGSLPRNRYPPPGNVTAGKAFVWMDRFLDEMRVGPQWLRIDSIAALVVDSIRHGERVLRHYEVDAFAVMPNHVHLLIVPLTSIPKLMRRLKGYTARQANKILNRTGEGFWQTESYDHWVRSERERVRISRYVEDNPVRAGLVSRPDEYRWSSAARQEPTAGMTAGVASGTARSTSATTGDL